jgi:hypothetical protein
MEMAIIVIAIVVAATYWHRGRFLASWTRRGGPVLVDRAFGLASMSLPKGWRAARRLNEAAGVEAINPLLGRHLILISESRADFCAGMTALDHAAVTVHALASSLHLLSVSAPSTRRVGRFDATQVEIEGFREQAHIKFLHTTIAGDRAFHQVITWAAFSRYDRRVFDRMLDGFSERPGPAPEVATRAMPVAPTPDDTYTVH